MDSLITEIVKIGGGKVLDLFTPAVVEGRVVNHNDEPVPNVIVHVGGQNASTYISGKFLLKVRRGIYDISIEYEGRRYDNVEGIYVGSGEKIEAKIRIPEISEPDQAQQDKLSSVQSKPLDNNEAISEESLPSEATEELSSPTRFAKKYIQNQPDTLQNAIYSITDGLPASITYHSTRDGSEYLTLRQSKKPDWEMYIVARPRKKTLEVLFSAGADETLTGQEEGETYMETIAEFKVPRLRKSHPTWGAYLNFELSEKSSDLDIEAARMAINWFLLESYQPYSE